TRFGNWQRIGAELAGDSSEGRTLATPGPFEGSSAGLVSTQVASRHLGVEDALRAPTDQSVSLLVAAPQPQASNSGRSVGSSRAAASQRHGATPSTILVAGHDLKFARSLLEALEDA